MRIKKIKFKNFCSYGNVIQEIEFPEDNEGFFLVSGKNGYGKTTISEVIKFNLYGKVDGKKLKSLPNRINNNLWTWIELECKGKGIVIERGYKPNKFQITINGKPYDKAKDPQAYLEEELFGIPFYVFINIISLDVDQFKSFLKMTSKDKREIVDRILGFLIINKMIEVVRQQVSSIRKDITTLDGKISSTNLSLETSMAEMESLTTKIASASLDKKEEFVTNLAKFEQLQKLHQDKLTEFNIDHRTFSSKVSKAGDALSLAKSNVRSIEDKLRLYDNSKCPMCEGELETDHHHHIQEGLSKDLISHKANQEDASKLVNELMLKKKALDADKWDMTEKGMKIQNKITNFTQSINDLDMVGSRKDQLESLENILKKMNTQIGTDKTGKFGAEQKLNWSKMMEDTLGGMKHLSIKSILPTYNAEILRLLKDMDVEYRVIFDENFDANITHLGIDVDAAELSRGETKKVDFAALIAIIKLVKLKYPDLNLLFLDEIFSSLDPEAIDQVLDILKENCNKLGLNTFVISHNPVPSEIFDYKINIEKRKHHSNLSVEQMADI